MQPRALRSSPCTIRLSYETSRHPTRLWLPQGAPRATCTFRTPRLNLFRPTLVTWLTNTSQTGATPTPTLEPFCEKGSCPKGNDRCRAVRTFKSICYFGGPVLYMACVVYPSPSTRWPCAPTLLDRFRIRLSSHPPPQQHPCSSRYMARHYGPHNSLRRERHLRLSTDHAVCTKKTRIRRRR